MASGKFYLLNLGIGSVLESQQLSFHSRGTTARQTSAILENLRQSRDVAPSEGVL